MNTGIDLVTLVNQFMALGGVGALIAVSVNILKAAGIVKDGQAPVYVTAGGILGMAGLLVLRLFQPGADLPGIDLAAQQIATVLEILLGFVVQILAARASHAGLAGVPLIGKSYSQERRINGG